MSEIKKRKSGFAAFESSESNRNLKRQKSKKLAKAAVRSFVFSPTFNVIALVFLLLAVFAGMRIFSARRNPAQVSFVEQAGVDAPETEKAENQNYSAPEIFRGEVYDTSIRLRETGALGMAISLAVFAEFSEKKNIPTNLETVLNSKTYQDFPGKKSDNVRYAEQKRLLMHAGEVRQIAAHKELLIVCDTAPPIKAAYPPLAVMKNKFISREYGKPRTPFLGDVDAAYRLVQTSDENDSDTNSAAAESQVDLARAAQTETAQMAQIIDESVSTAINETTIYFDETLETETEFSAPLTEDEDVASRITATSANGAGNSKTSKPAAIVLTKTFEADASPQKKKTKKNESGATSDALSGLPDEVHALHQEIYAPSLLEINRCVI